MFIQSTLNVLGRFQAELNNQMQLFKNHILTDVNIPNQVVYTNAMISVVLLMIVVWCSLYSQIWSSGKSQNISRAYFPWRYNEPLSSPTQLFVSTKNYLSLNDGNTIETINYI